MSFGPKNDVDDRSVIKIGRRKELRLDPAFIELASFFELRSNRIEKCIVLNALYDFFFVVAIANIYCNLFFFRCCVDFFNINFSINTKT